VWLSEIMLQQTTVTTVIPYYLKFMTRWPTMKALANANIADVMSAWAGLGYYSRARNLHACAVQVTNEYDGSLPAGESGTPEASRHRPLYGRSHRLDRVRKAGSTRRWQHRARAVSPDVHRGAAAGVQANAEGNRAAAWRPRKHAGDFAQAMMDLGATICTPRSPSCLVCPWRDGVRGPGGRDCSRAAATRGSKGTPGQARGDLRDADSVRVKSFSNAGRTRGCWPACTERP
jgi:A/G-specific adenine glycosylase